MNIKLENNLVARTMIVFFSWDHFNYYKYWVENWIRFLFIQINDDNDDLDIEY